MPRLARLDAPGVLQHVMARGIERREIFRDDKDRLTFLNRLALILEETQTQCYVYPVESKILRVATGAEKDNGQYFTIVQVIQVGPGH